jgi:hypothetical protein
MPRRSRRWQVCLLLGIGLALAAMIGCSSGNQPTGPAGVYAKAKALFAKGANLGYDADIDALDKLASADPPTEYTTRARVLRLVYLSGQVQGYRTLSDAYAKGADTAKPAALKSEYNELRRNVDQRGAELTLTLGEVAMQLTKGGELPKDLVLDLPYPTVDVPPGIPALDTARTGVEIGREDQAQAELLATRTGVVDALAAILHTDRAKAQSEMNAGPVTIDPTEFRLFVADQIMAGAVFYDPKHLYDPTHYKLLTGVAQDALQPVQATLKQTPNPDSAKHLKKLQDQIKSGLKAFPSSV